MEPQTPPARRVTQLNTPNTPRYGPMDDVHFLDTRKKLFEEPEVAVPLTPRTTPRRRIFKAPKTPLRGSGRQAPRRLAKIDEGIYISSDHPHHPKKQLQGEGAMYVFRGKKVWRPFDKFVKPMEPTRLFPSAMEPTQLFGSATDDSEAETDIEV